MSDSNNYKTPGDFITYYMDAMKEELNTYDIQANKVGFLGFLMNLLGNTTYDSKTYVDMLFKEAFAASAQEDDNLYMHGAIYGYQSSLATAATATGALSLDMSLLPAMPTNAIKREVIFNNSTIKSEIIANDTIFTSGAKYTFIYDTSSYQTVVTREDGTIINVPSTSSTVTAPLYDFKQEEVETVELTLPNYSYGSYYTYVLSVDDDVDISGIEVYVTESSSSTEVEYEIKNVKYFEDSTSESVFFRKISSEEYNIDFGSGIRGKWVPGASVRIVIYKTTGSTGNLGLQTTATINYPEQCVIIDRFADETAITQTIETSKYLTASFEYSEGGIDPLTGDDLRNSLVEFIQSRDNFISETDFYNITDKYKFDFRFLFKKMLVQDNIFYLQRVFRDKYQNVVKSFNYTFEIFNDDQSFGEITVERNDTGGQLDRGTYRYIIEAEDRFGNKIQTEQLSISVVQYGASITFSWDSVNNAIKYRIYGRETEPTHYWETTHTTFIDDGSTDGTETSVEKVGIYFPKFTVNGIDFVSPFFYKYNSKFDWYDGYLFYSSMVKNFSTTTTISQSSLIPLAPSIFLSIVYDNNLQKTTFFVKSYQKISSWNFKISIPELNITTEMMTQQDESTFYYEYTENGGLITDSFIVIIKEISSGEEIYETRTEYINQVIDISDVLKIPVYRTSTTKYLVCLPVIEYDIFYSDEKYYLDKLYEFINGLSFTENRMISDDLQFRFLNSNAIKAFLLENSTVQGRELFSDITWLLNDPICFSNVPTKAPVDGESWIIGGSYYDESGTLVTLSPSIEIDSTEVDGEAIRFYGSTPWGGASGGQLTPYRICLLGDYTNEIAPYDIIRIKEASSSGVNGEYHVAAVYKDQLYTYIEVNEQIEASVKEGKLFYAEYQAWRRGGPDNIATWNSTYNSWKFTSVKPSNAITVKTPARSLVYNTDYIYEEYSLQLPLNISLSIYVDKNSATANNINLADEEDTIILELAQELQNNFTGTDIVYYPSKIIDFISDSRNTWIKGMTVKTTDSNEYPKTIANGLETLSEDDIRTNIISSKLEMVKYSSTFYWWNVDNITIKFYVI